MKRAHGPPTLATVHIPKTAGTTFLDVLQRTYGDDLRLDYDDRPLAHARWDRRLSALRHASMHVASTSKVRCIHGHFMPVKYATMRRLRFCTWLRDPVQRVLSRYHHYLRHVERETRHARWGLVPGLTLEQFVRLPHYQDTYAEYLWMFPLDRFDFIGITEHFESELARFGECFGIALEPAASPLNQNPDKPHPTYEVEPAMERLIRECNPRDVAIYARALAPRARQQSNR